MWDISQLHSVPPGRCHDCTSQSFSRDYTAQYPKRLSSSYSQPKFHWHEKCMQNFRMKPERNISLGKHQRRWKEIPKHIFKKYTVIAWNGLNWPRIRISCVLLWKSYVHQDFMGTENFLTSLASIIFSRRSALCGVAYCIFPSNYFITRFVYLTNISW
jgi:hypothetical protein